MIRTLFVRNIVFALAGFLALGISGSEYLTLRLVDADRPGESLDQLRAWQPWGGLAGQSLVRDLHGTDGLDLVAAEAALAWQLARSPLNPWRWLDRAEFAYLSGKEWARVLWHLDSAVAVQPRSSRLRLRAAEIAWRTGHYPVAEENLRFWLEAHPEGTERALRIASGWIADPESLIARILPEGEPYLVRALAFARREQRLELALLVWGQLDRPRPPDDEALFHFVELALITGGHELAAGAWAESFPDYVFGQVPNADFTHDPGSGRGLHWRRSVPAGVAVARDSLRFRTEPASLRVDFHGSHNVALHQPSLPIPVPAADEARDFRLSGYWRGEALTTRSLPYLQLTPEGGAAARITVPHSLFGWTPFVLEVNVPAGSALLTLQIRRDPVRVEFDRNISGRLWVDALRLDPLPAPDEST